MSFFGENVHSLENNDSQVEDVPDVSEVINNGVPQAVSENTSSELESLLGYSKCEENCNANLITSQGDGNQVGNVNASKQPRDPSRLRELVLQDTLNEFGDVNIRGDSVSIERFIVSFTFSRLQEVQEVDGVIGPRD